MNESFASPVAQTILSVQDKTSPDLERHSRKCSICRHPDRDAIEEEFIHWHRVIWIAQQYDIYDHRSIYRHARALGLIKARRENLHSALDNIVEQSDGINASAGDVLKAIRAYTCLSDTGRWTELPLPPRHLIYSSNACRAVGDSNLVPEERVNHVHPEGTNGDRRAPADPNLAYEERASRAVAGTGSAREGGPPVPATGGPEPAREASTTLEAAAELSEEIADLAEAPASKTEERNDVPAEANETEVGVELDTNRPDADTFSVPSAEPASDGVQAEANDVGVLEPAEPDNAPAEANETEVGVEPERDADRPGPPPLAQRVPFVIYSTDHDILDRAAGIDHRPYGRR